MDNKSTEHKKWIYLIIGLVIGVITGVLGNQFVVGNQSVDPQKPGYKEDFKEEVKEEVRKGKTTFSLGEEIDYKDFTVTITNQREVLAGYPKVTHKVFDVEVVSKIDGLDFQGNFQGVTEDNLVVDDTFAMSNEDLGDPIMLNYFKIDKGQKIRGYLAFDKPIVKIELLNGYFSTEKVTILID